MTIDPGHSDSDGGFGLDDGELDQGGAPATGVFIKKDHFTASLQTQFVIEDDSQQRDERGGGAEGA